MSELTASKVQTGLAIAGGILAVGSFVFLLMWGKLETMRIEMGERVTRIEKRLDARMDRIQERMEIIAPPAVPVPQPRPER